VAGEALKKYKVELTPAERGQLETLTRKGRHSVRRVKRGLVLLAASDGEKDETIAARVGVTTNLVARTRKRYAEEGLEQALSERPRSGKPRRFDGRQDAYVIALACSDPPEGHARWTLRLLANRMVELKVVEGISHHTVGRMLKRGSSNRGSAANGASPR
jgi:transposase